MTWKNILMKAQIPPEPPEGAVRTEQYRQQMDTWAMAYEQDVLRQCNEQQQLDTENSVANGGSGYSRGYFKFENNRVIMGNRAKTVVDFRQFANSIKRFVRNAVYNPGSKYSSYAVNGDKLAKIPNNVVAMLGGNSTAIQDYYDWIKDKGV